MMRVVIVDDSATLRVALTRVLEAREIEVIASYGNPKLALSQIPKLKPDAVTADVHMPAMDGISFVRALMDVHPCPVVMVSSLTKHGSRTTFDALDAGAVDFVCKPASIAQLDEIGTELALKLKAACRARMISKPPVLEIPVRAASSVLPRAQERISSPPEFRRPIDVVVIGGSTGAPQMLPELLQRIRRPLPGIVVALHMPAGFTRSFAERIQSGLPDLKVAEARPGQPIAPGLIWIAPGDFHVRMARVGEVLRTIVEQTPAVNRHRPSVDVLFESCAAAAGERAIGVLLTGMGQDGAAGLLRMREAGAHTLVQTPASCLVAGMPSAAIAKGAPLEVLEPRQIAERLSALIHGLRGEASAP